MSKCYTNVVACIQDVVANMFFTNIEALGDAEILRLLAHTSVHKFIELMHA